MPSQNGRVPGYVTRANNALNSILSNVYDASLTHSPNAIIIRQYQCGRLFVSYTNIEFRRANIRTDDALLVCRSFRNDIGRLVGGPDE